MNRTERLAVIILFAGLMAWLVYGPRPQRPEPPDPDTVGEAPRPAPAREDEAPDRPGVPTLAPDLEPAAPDAPPAPVEPERIVTLDNERLRVAVSSHGAAVTGVKLHTYPRQAGGDEPIRLDFELAPALALDGLPGGRPDMAFELEPGADGMSLTARRTLGDGLVIERRLVLADEYRLQLTDTYINTGAGALALTNVSVRTGAMPPVAETTRTRGISYLEVDTLSAGKVMPWAKTLNREFGAGGCARPDPRSIPATVDSRLDVPANWIAAKNKFFVQILAPEREAVAFSLAGWRDPDSPGSFELSAVGGALVIPAVMLDPGLSHTESFSYYVGPKEFSRLRQLGHRQDAVMFRPWTGFGWWRWACIGLLYLLNGIYRVIPNYGWAIILLTLIVKLVFWPVTHKGNLHMRKMQSLQPELKKLREKYKDKPKKLQEAQMSFYQQHGVNPLAGCLPMVVQIPVFIALFTVLRSAVELRFAGFLWIADLSEPEGLLAGQIPFPAGGLNLLPLAMTATMVLQQRLTPAATDPQQQKMMMFMPLMMLFFFYSMPSALVLYWTVSQSLSIVQLMVQRRAVQAEVPAGKA